MTEQPSLSSPASRASSEFTSRSLDSSFSRDSTGNQSAMKFINAQSTLADRVGGLARVLESMPRKVLIRKGTTHSDRLSGHKVIGTSDNSTCAVFASLPNT